MGVDNKIQRIKGVCSGSEFECPSGIGVPSGGTSGGIPFSLVPTIPTTNCD